LRLIGEAPVVDQERRRRIGQDVLQLRHGEPPVERQHDGAQPSAGELQLEVFRAIGRQEGHSIAFADSSRGERARQPVGAGMQVGVAQLPSGLQVMDREPGRPAAGVMGDPVVVGDGGHLGLT
jgi:hypothetical protein